MTSTENGRVVPGQLESFGVPPFDGYPYLVTRIGHSVLRHVALLPGDWSRERLVDLARRQRDANRLDTCVVLGRHDAVYLYLDGAEGPAEHMPYGLPVIDRLMLAEDFPETPELAARRTRLAAFEAAYRGKGYRYIVGDNLEGGRPAEPEDFERLGERGADGVPAGLHRCPTCGRFAGDYLALKGEGNLDPSPRVVEVHCHCTNHNRCARCGEQLAGSRLSAYFWDEEDRNVWYVAAYSAFSHRCAVS